MSEQSKFPVIPRSGSRKDLAAAVREVQSTAAFHLAEIRSVTSESKIVEYTDHLVAALNLIDPGWFGRGGSAEPGGSSPGGSSPGGSSPGGSSPGGSSPGGSSPGGSSPGGSSPGGSSPGGSSPGGSSPGGSSPGGSSPGGSSPGGSSPGGSSPGGSSPGGSSPGGSSPGGSSPGGSIFNPDEFVKELQTLGILIERATTVLRTEVAQDKLRHIVGVQEIASQLAGLRPERFSAGAGIGVTSPFEGRGRSLKPQRPDEG